VTLGLLAWLLAGTVAGALLRDHVVVAGTLISATWILATWRGVRLLRTPAAACGHDACDRVSVGTSGDR
jgi:hypothetical protein